MSAKRAYPLAVVILLFGTLGMACSGTPGLTIIVPRVTPPGPAGIVVPQPSPQSRAVTPTPVSRRASSAARVPGIAPTRRHLLVITGETFGATPEPTVSTVQPAEPTGEPETPASGLEPTAVPVPTPFIVPTSTLSPTPTAVPVTPPTKTPGPLPTATVPPPLTGVGVIIECIFFDGQVADSEADEYVQIYNQGPATVNLFRWRLQDVADGTPTFTFPAYELHPRAFVRVYTNEDHPEYGGFSFERSSSVWNNTSPDRAALIDPIGAIVFQKSYPPGC